MIVWKWCRNRRDLENQFANKNGYDLQIFKPISASILVKEQPESRHSSEAQDFAEKVLSQASTLKSDNVYSCNLVLLS